MCSVRGNLGGLLPSFFFEDSDVFLNLHGVRSTGENFEIFLVGLDCTGGVMLLFVGFAQKDPRLRQFWLVACGLLEAIDRRVMNAFFR